MFFMQTSTNKHPRPATVPQEQLGEPEPKRLRSADGKAVPASEAAQRVNHLDSQRAELSNRPNNGSESGLRNRVSPLNSTSPRVIPSCPIQGLFFIPVQSCPVIHPSNLPDSSIMQPVPHSNQNWIAIFIAASKVLDQDPGNLQALINILEALQYVGTNGEYTKYAETLMNKVEQLQSDGNWEESLKGANGFLRTMCERSLSLPMQPFALICKAEALEKLGRIPEALQAADESLDILMYKFANVELLNKFKSVDDMRSKALICKSKAMQSLRQYPESLDAAKRALGFSPNNVAALILAAEALRELGHFCTALDEIERALKIQPDNAELKACKIKAIIATVDYVISKKSYIDALPYIEMALSLNPDLLRIYGQKLYVLKQLDDLPAAIEVCKQAIALCEEKRKASEGSRDQLLFIQQMFADGLNTLENEIEKRKLVQFVRESNDYIDGILGMPNGHT